MEEPHIKNYINSNLKHIRIKRKLSQNKFGELLNVNQTTIARWEDDNRKPSIDKAIEISKILNISLDRLTGIDLSEEELQNENIDIKNKSEK